MEGSKSDKTDADGAGIAGTEISAGVEVQDDEDRFPEPAQVVARYFTVHASDLVLRVSDLDVAVLVTMAKSIVRVRERVGPDVASVHCRLSRCDLTPPPFVTRVHAVGGRFEAPCGIYSNAWCAP